MYCSSRPKSTHKKCMFILTTPSLLLADRLVKIPEVASGDGAAHYGESVYMIFSVRFLPRLLCSCHLCAPYKCFCRVLLGHITDHQNVENYETLI